MKIWIVGRGYPTPDNKMFGSFELEQAKLLARYGHNVSYIALTLSFFDRKDPRGFRKIIDNGVNVFLYSHFYFPGKTGIYLAKYEDLLWGKLFAEAEKETGIPDIIHVHYPSMISSIYNIEEYRKKGVKLFATEHWSRVLNKNLRKHELSRLSYYVNHANCFAAVSEALIRSIKDYVSVNVPMIVIPNIVSPVFFQTYNKEQQRNFTFIAVGRLISIKQFDIVIRQFINAFSGLDNVRLKIVGSGPERGYLESLTKGNKQITFTGGLSIEETSIELARSNALVSYSKYETFAVPVAEGWAAGKPCIVSDKSGIASYVNKDLGMVVSASSEEELKEAMRCIYRNIDIYESEKIKGYAEKHFSDVIIEKKLEQMYAM